MSRFGELIFKARTDKGLTVRELAAKAKMSPGYLSEIEHGKKNPPKDPQIIRRLAKALDLDENELFSLAKESRITPEKIRELRRFIQSRGELGFALLRAVEKAPEYKLEKIIKELLEEENG
ncbi:helix-turn-helix domain-containing protein [Thermodesulfatator autotrophicus]|uniref:HTH cro/C1-type domain-containing protein n=1 Tax=Thermodesulfatator autotrophicus TaxID=1795632 RepID=A0A177E3U9_9BACT|nr:helix-turn-helix domain-containing protein [Thermodesulfatator autotrophicus]OAG26667.1 hypothetical protein TH606_11150 [Thermodesulfatator autotrophicus]